MLKLFLVLVPILIYPLWLRAEAGPLVVGIMAELSGPAAGNGVNCRIGHEMAYRAWALTGKVGAREVKIAWGDTQGLAKVGVTELRRLVDVDKAEVVVVNRSQVGMALSPLAQQRKLPLLGVVGHPDFVRDNEYAFRFWPPTEQEGRALAALANKEGFRRLAIISTEDYFTLALRQSVISNFGADKSLVVFDETVPPDLIDFRVILPKLRVSNPDIIVVNLALGQTSIGLKRIREAGFTQPIYATYFASLPSELADAGSAAEAVVMVEIDFRFPKFMALLKETAPDAEPAAITFVCYSASAALYQALASLPGVASASDIWQALKALKQVHMPDGPLDFVQRELRYKLRYVVVKDGQPTPLLPDGEEG